jgi:flagellar export protein FliJ
MKKWKFNLEAVAFLKTRIENEAAQKHARALVAAGRAKAALAETEKELNTAALFQYSAGKKSSDLLQLSQYITTLERVRRERLEKCLHAERDATLARAALEKAAREREILDQLRDRQYAQHRFHVARHEQQWIDELAQQMKRGLLAAL